MSEKEKQTPTKREVVETKFTTREKIEMFFQGLFNFFLINRVAMACLIAIIITTAILIYHYPR